MVSRIYKIIIVVVAVVVGESTGQKDLSKFLLFRGVGNNSRDQF